jgi:hypothetical protein
VSFCYKFDNDQKKIAVESDEEGYIRIYPSLHETPEIWAIMRLLRLLKRMKKYTDLCDDLNILSLLNLDSRR